MNRTFSNVAILLRNKGSLLTSMDPWRTFNILGNISFHRKVLCSRKGLFRLIKCFYTKKKLFEEYKIVLLWHLCKNPLPVKCHKNVLHIFEYIIMFEYIIIWIKLEHFSFFYHLIKTIIVYSYHLTFLEVPHKLCVGYRVNRLFINEMY